MKPDSAAGIWPGLLGGMAETVPGLPMNVLIHGSPKPILNA